ncbi:hypothetical protein F6W96_25360 [Nocardia terpenica]|uniref:Uncharacterized protein n=1 Tax=Nocardia terpenica TaxID=455432 RepID=A0A6G9Z7L2_9NOCA|nr:hypothetical protein F6W96_25360 [Nocardia terpenica]
MAKHAHAPLGSTYHYFPGGKQQLVTGAVQFAGGIIASIGHISGERGICGEHYLVVTWSEHNDVVQDGVRVDSRCDHRQPGTAFVHTHAGGKSVGTADPVAHGKPTTINVEPRPAPRQERRIREYSVTLSYAERRARGQ